MNRFSETSVDLQDTEGRHNAWKSRIHNFIHSPLLWRKTNRQSTILRSLPDESLETLLRLQCGQTAFRDFLKSEFCEENLDFWLACQEFKSLESPEELRLRGASIYEEFISTESLKQVNLDFYTRELIRRNLRQPNASCFVAAQKKIFSLLENDAFPRFIQSKQYKVLLAVANKQKGLAKHLNTRTIKSTGDLMQHDSKAIIPQSDLYLLRKD